VQICDWQTHDATWPTDSAPPDVLHRLGVDAHGVDNCDARVRRRDVTAYLDLRDHLLTSVERKTQLTETLTAREEWDVVHVVYGESHCAGHHFWGLRDPATRPYVADAPTELRSAMTGVYRALDGALGRLVVAAGPDTRVMVVTSHGMGKYVGGYQLLPEVLARLDLRRGAGPVRSALRRRTPWRVRSLARRLVPAGPRERALAALGERPECDLRDPATRATAVPNNRCGAIRLNLRGREPFGRVEPGLDAEEVIDRLRAELLALRDPRTGEAIVTSVDRPVDSGRPRLHPDLPDLTVAFRQDLGPIETCTSPGVGLVEVPLWPRTGRPDWPLGLGRTGDHTAETRIWIRAPGFAPAVTGCRSVLDVAPTALTLLGVPAPACMEGRPLVAPATVTR